MDSDSDRLFRNVFGGVGNDSDEERSESSDEDDFLTFDEFLRRVRQNDPRTTLLHVAGYVERVQETTDEDWERLGQDIVNNSHVEKLRLYEGALNDHRMSCFFRGLTRSVTMKELSFRENGFSIAGVRSMVPFLQNASSLRELELGHNNIQSEGFNVLFRALRDSPIEYLSCDECGIESIEIDIDHIPQNLLSLNFSGNSINADGCRELAKLLQVDSTLEGLCLSNNKIDDEGVAILVGSLQNNKSLDTLSLRGNDDISNQGQIMLLKLVNDITSIQATLQSNHTLRYIYVNFFNEEIQTHINIATGINKRDIYNPGKAGREKVILHLHSKISAELAELQGVDHSVYSEIDPLHLPEVLSLIGERHGQGELYAAVSSSIMTLLSTVNRKKCFQQERDYHAAIIAQHRTKVDELDAELGAIEAAEGNECNEEIEHRSNKRRRKWWWGLFGYGST